MAEDPGAFRDGVVQLTSACLGALYRFEAIARRLHPNVAIRLRDHVEPLAPELAKAREAFHAHTPPAGWEPLARRLDTAAGVLATAVESFLATDRGAFGVLGALRSVCRAQEALYPLRRVLLPVARFFTEPALHEHLDSLEPDPPEGVATGFFAVPAPEAVSGSDDTGVESVDARGGALLYVPETYDGAGDWPLIVALHGGYGHGRDFLWTWLREARSRRALLLAPTSVDTTWSLLGPDRDRSGLGDHLSWVRARWRVDESRLLLTGLSDGATYALLAGLAADSPFTAIAPVSGVVHPRSFENGNLGRARGRRIRLVHGALDWMFPVEIARAGAKALHDAGADLVYDEIEDLPHAWPREANGAILEWFDAGLVPRTPGGVAGPGAPTPS